MENGTKRFALDERCRIGVVSAGEFVVYAIRRNRRVALLGPPHCGDRSWRLELRRHDFSHVEVVADEATDWTFEYLKYSNGVEVLDPTPVALPVAAGPPALSDVVRDLVAHHLSRAAQANDLESFEEASDFEVDDDDELRSPFEFEEMDDDVLEPLSDGPQGSGAAAPTNPGEDAGDAVPPAPGRQEGAQDGPPGAGAPGGNGTPPSTLS